MAQQDKDKNRSGSTDMGAGTGTDNLDQRQRAGGYYERAMHRLNQRRQEQGHGQLGWQGREQAYGQQRWDQNRTFNPGWNQGPGWQGPGWNQGPGWQGPGWQGPGFGPGMQNYGQDMQDRWDRDPFSNQDRGGYNQGGFGQRS